MIIKQKCLYSENSWYVYLHENNWHFTSNWKKSVRDQVELNAVWGWSCGQVRAGEGRWGYVRAGEGVWGQVRVCEGRWGQVRVCKGRWGCVRAGEGVWGQVRAGEGVWGQVRAGEGRWEFWGEDVAGSGETFENLLGSGYPTRCHVFAWDWIFFAYFFIMYIVTYVYVLSGNKLTFQFVYTPFKNLVNLWYTFCPGRLLNHLIYVKT